MTVTGERLSEIFVELADTLIDEFDVVDFMTVLASRCVELLDATEVGLILADQRGNLRVVGSSSERMHVLELFELQNEEGPCLDCLRNGEQVVNEPLEEADARWPRFAPEARRVGYRTAHALPMRLRGHVIGALNAFSSNGRRLSPAELRIGQAMADVATIGMLQQQAVNQARQLAEQLQTALNTRVAIEQAKGVLAERLGIDVDEGFAILRTHARSNNRRLSDVAAEVVDGRLPVDRLAVAGSPEPNRHA